MDITIEKQEKNPLLLREEIQATTKTEGATPSLESIKKELSSKLKSQEDLMVIKSIRQQFGKNEVKITAYVYENQEVLKRYESKGKEEKKEGEEKPAEEKKE